MQQNNNGQDEIITNIQENQRALTKGLSDLLEPYQREIIFRDELPKMIEDKGSDEDLIQLGDDEDLTQLGDEDLIQLEGDEAKPSTSKIETKIMDPDQGMSDEYKKFLDEKDLPLPSKIIVEDIDTKSLIPKVQDKINRSEKYIKDNSTKKGQPYKTLSNQKKENI